MIIHSFINLLSFTDAMVFIVNGTFFLLLTLDAPKAWTLACNEKEDKAVQDRSIATIHYR
jgi:hypothetical protein